MIYTDSEDAIVNLMFRILNNTTIESYTELAEIAADELGHDEWLNDGTHYIWDAALKALGEYNQA